MAARAEELKSGGSFVAANFCVSSEGHFLGNTEVGMNMWDSFRKCWRRLGSDIMEKIGFEKRIEIPF